MVAAVLAGDVNPSGKLPITFPKSMDDVPAHTPEQYSGAGPRKQTTARYSEGLLVGYRWYDARKIEPLFPFGFGLSYTTFAYGKLHLSTAALSASAPTLTVDFDVANTGSRAGEEVTQVYLGVPALPGVEQPPRKLAGFTESVSIRARPPMRVSRWTHGRFRTGMLPRTIGKSRRAITAFSWEVRPAHCRWKGTSACAS